MLSLKVGHCNPRLVPEMVRGVSSSTPAAASHYDVLGISSKATHNDIKSAYYKLSMLHHPDKSSDELSVRKFRAITEAYEILGNIKSKQLYDKTLAHGLRSAQVTYEPAEEPQDPVVRFYRSRMNRHMTATLHGKTPIYDFDAWTKHHYGDMLKRSQLDKEKSRIRREKHTIITTAIEKEAEVYGVAFLIVIISVFAISINRTTNYDRNQLTREINAAPDAKT